MLAASSPLRLEGLEIASSGDAPLLASQGAALWLNDCLLSASGNAPAVVARGCDLNMHTCRVRARRTAIAVELDDRPSVVELAANAVNVSDHGGTAVALWASEAAAPAKVRLNLDRNVLQAARVLAVQALPGRVQIDASANDFTFTDALLSFAGYAGNESWRRSTAWNGRDNYCHAPGCWLQVDGRPVAVNDAAGWQRIWAFPPVEQNQQEAAARPAGLR
jgi:hypothetical protein